MFNFFRNKNHPSFWKTYIKKFKQKQPTTIEKTRFIVFDTETTGLNIETDRVLSIVLLSMLTHLGAPGARKFLNHTRKNGSHLTYYTCLFQLVCLLLRLPVDFFHFLDDP